LGAARTTPFYEPAALVTTDLVKGKETIEALKVFDASPDVLVIIEWLYYSQRRVDGLGEARAIQYQGKLKMEIHWGH